MAAMVEAAGELRDRLVLKLLASTGMRPRGLRDLRRRDVSDDREWLSVRASKTGTARRLPAPDGLQRLLRLWLDHGYRASEPRAEQSPHLVPGRQADRLSETAVRRLVHRAAVEARIQEVLYEDAKGDPRYRVTPYSFRKGYANAMKDEVDPERLAELMGHETVETTMTYYASTSEEALREAASAAPDP